MRPLPFFVLTLTLAASCVLEDKPVDPGVDGGMDGGVCNPPCADETPICNANSECVECTETDPTYCAESMLVCKTGGFECVDCNTSAECDDADAAHCNPSANACDGCVGDADCIGITGLPRCESSTETCVQCTPDTEAADCDGTSCDPATFTCTTTEVGSVGTCEECVADSECGEAGNRCVAMEYQGAAYPDEETGFCLKTFGTGDPCVRPYLVPLPDRESLSGAPAANYCGVDEANVTCPAVLALLNDVGCPLGDECPTGGLCRDLAGGVALDRCTYLCELPAQCPTGEPANTCSSSGPGGDDYCGG